MSINLDPDASIPLKCPKCGRQFEKSVGWIQANPNVSCPYCGQSFDVRQFASGLEDANKIDFREFK
jgi:uncharacterized Zn-finger protein